MAPPPPATLPLTERLQRLATTLQFAWFAGHATLLTSVFYYALSYVTFKSNSKAAAFAYRLAFISAVATYGIVVFKAFRARVRSSANAGTALLLLSDENVQYLLISLVWLYSRQIPLALLPFTVYSVFHVATYTRTNLIPTFQPPQQTPGATPTSPGAAKSQSGLANTIGKFVKQYYDASMGLVALLEILLWGRLFLSALTFSKGSWILMAIYSIFLRARYQQSQFVQSAFSKIAARIDQQVQNPNAPPALKQGWGSVKDVSARFIDATDVRNYTGGAAQKKPQ